MDDEKQLTIRELTERIKRIEFVLGLRGGGPYGNYYPGDQVIEPKERG